MYRLLFILIILAGCTTPRMSQCPDPDKNFENALIPHKFKQHTFKSIKKNSVFDNLGSNERLITASLKPPKVNLPGPIFIKKSVYLIPYQDPSFQVAQEVLNTERSENFTGKHAEFNLMADSVITEKEQMILEAEKAGELSFWASLMAIGSGLFLTFIPLLAGAFLPLSIIGVVSGIKARRLYKKTGEKISRKAWWGIFLSSLILLSYVLALIALIWVFLSYAYN